MAKAKKVAKKVNTTSRIRSADRANKDGQNAAAIVRATIGSVYYAVVDTAKAVKRPAQKRAKSAASWTAGFVGALFSRS